MKTAAALSTTLLAAAATAQPATLTIDEAQSSINVFAVAMTPVGNDDDSATSAIAGTVEITLDDYGTPTAITVEDFMFALTTDPVLNFSFGALGNANSTLESAVATYAGLGPTGPVPLGAAGAFDFPAVPTLLMGTAQYDYSFFLVGSDSGSVDLGSFGANDAPFVGNITSDGTTITLNATFELDALVPVVAGLVDVALTGTAVIVASGPVPIDPSCNPADVAAPFGIIDLSDVDAFIAAFLVGDPLADLAAPLGIIDLSDVDEFVTLFVNGCP